MKHVAWIVLLVVLTGCNAMKKLDDQVYIQQRSKMAELPRIDSLLIVASGTSATQQIAQDFLTLFQEALRKSGVNSQQVFVSYSGKRINEAEFDNRKYQYTLWVYEQDRALQLLANYEHLVPLAIKLTNNQNSQNIWIATSIVNNMVRKKYYKEKYAGMLYLLFKANGLVQ